MAIKPRRKVFETYWRFAAERQAIFYKRLAGDPQPWTRDPILRRYKFCNAYRASDRVSQFLLRNVIYTAPARDEDVVFRTLLFRLFNHIGTWSLVLEAHDGAPHYGKGWPERARLSELMTSAMARGSVFGGAYMIAPPGSSLGRRFSRKHDGYLELIDRMMRDNIARTVATASSLRGVYDALRSYPLIGPFMAYQLAVDLNYSELIDHDEDSFTMAGPGAVRGIKKCFEDTDGRNCEEIICWMVDSQEELLRQLGCDPERVWLWGRPLKAIDCQNLFCETDKYARVAFPELESNRTRIKVSFRPTKEKIGYFYPPKWGLNDGLHESSSRHGIGTLQGIR